TTVTGIGVIISSTTSAFVCETATLKTVGTVSLMADGDVTRSAGLNAGASTVTIHANQAGAGTNGFTQNPGGDIQTSNATAAAVSITVDTGVTGAALGNITTGSGGMIAVGATGNPKHQTGGPLDGGSGT